MARITNERTLRDRPTRERILDAALDLFGMRGVDAVSLDEIARTVGVRKQTILYWFPSKDALVDSVLEAVAAELFVDIDAAIRSAPDDPLERIDAVVRAVFRPAVRRPSMLGLVREVSRALAGEHALVVRDTGGKGGCFKGRAKIRPSQASLTFKGCLAGAETFERPFSVEEGSSLKKLLVEGLKKKGQGKLDPVVTLEAPSAAATEFLPDGRKVVVKGEPLPEAGDWALRIAGFGGNTGCFKAKLNVDQGGAM